MKKLSKKVSAAPRLSQAADLAAALAAALNPGTPWRD